jgi:hypothetical protein
MSSILSPMAEPAHLSGASTLRFSARSLMAVVWASSALFGLYIVAFYGRAVFVGEPERWNTVLPGLYAAQAPFANSGIGLHFAAGGLILMLGCVQLLEGVRRRWPVLHRWIGRVYVSAALVAGLGGLAFIVAKGTIGGTPMDLGFGLYGVLTVLAAVQTWRHAHGRRLEVHRAWALRLFALAVGSWLYRMEYGIWMLLAGGLGHQPGFTGPFDQVMAFFFYLPNLLVVELYLRARRTGVAPAVRWSSSVAMLSCSALVGVGTYFFTRYYWWPGITGAMPGG